MEESPARVWTRTQKDLSSRAAFLLAALQQWRWARGEGLLRGSFVQVPAWGLLKGPGSAPAGPRQDHSPEPMWLWLQVRLSTSVSCSTYLVSQGSEKESPYSTHPPPNPLLLPLSQASQEQA